jgi:hypothetical protein
MHLNFNLNTLRNLEPPPKFFYGYALVYSCDVFAVVFYFTIIRHAFQYRTRRTSFILLIRGTEVALCCAALCCIKHFRKKQTKRHFTIGVLMSTSRI